MLIREFEKIFSILLILILSILFFYIEDGINDIIIAFSLFIFYAYFFKSIKKPTKIVNNVKTYISIELFFLLFFYLVFYYPYQLYLLGLYDLEKFELPYNLYLNMVNKSLILTDIALVSFMLGFNTKFYNNSKQNKVKVSLTLLNYLTNFFILILIVSFIIFFATGGVKMFVGSYVGSDSGSITGNAIFNVINIFFTLLIINIIYTYWLFRKLMIKNIIISIIIIIWCLLLLILGDRNTFFLLSIAIGGGIFTFIKSISKVKIVLLIFFGISIYNIVEETRNIENLNLDSILVVFNKDEKEKSSYGADMFSTSLVTLRSSLKIISDKKDFYYGKLKLVSFTSIIPYSSRIFISKDDKEYNSADIITEEMIGLNVGWNTGSNIISDFYFDFGIFGVFIGMFILGFYGGYIKNSLIKNPIDIKYFYLYIILMSYYSEISRYGFDFPLRIVVWTLFIFKIIAINSKTYK